MMAEAMNDELRELLHRVQYHPPVGLGVKESHELVREHIRRVMVSLYHVVPSGREKALMFTNLEQAMFWANAAVARCTENKGGDTP